MIDKVLQRKTGLQLSAATVFYLPPIVFSKNICMKNYFPAVKNHFSFVLNHLDSWYTSSISCSRYKNEC